MSKTPVYILIGLVIAQAALTVGQIWGPIIDWGTYLKVTATLGLAFLVIGLVIVIKSDLGNKKKLKDENYLD